MKNPLLRILLIGAGIILPARIAFACTCGPRSTVLGIHAISSETCEHRSVIPTREKAAMRLKPLASAFFFCAILTLSANAAFACTCAPTPTVLEDFEKSDVVMIGRVISLERLKGYIDGIRTATLVVEKVYKGNVKVRDEMVFGQGSGAVCTWNFQERHVGQQILFYLNTPKPELKWRATTCGRSSKIEDAKEDLLYLDHLQKHSGKTRISGDYRVGPEEGFGVANKTIRIVGQNKTYETRTNADGVYEIYDLPPGDYLLEPEIPKHWRLHWSVGLRNVPGSNRLHNSKKSVAFTLEPRKHVSIDVSFQPDNAVEGRIVDSSGNPVEGVDVHLWAPHETEGYGDYDHTDANGEFRIEGIDEGSYVLVVNTDELNTEKKYLRLFYPGVTQRNKATLIHIRAGQFIKDVNVVLKQRP